MPVLRPHSKVGDVIKDQVLHGLGGIIEVVGTTVMVVVPLVLPVQLEMRGVRGGARHRPGSHQRH